MAEEGPEVFGIVIAVDASTSERAFDEQHRDMKQSEVLAKRLGQTIGEELGKGAQQGTAATRVATRDQVVVQRSAQREAAAIAKAHSTTIAAEARAAANAGRLAARDELAARKAAQREAAQAARQSSREQIAAAREVANAAKLAAREQAAAARAAEQAAARVTAEYRKQAAAVEDAFGRLNKLNRGPRRVGTDFGAYAPAGPSSTTAASVASSSLGRVGQVALVAAAGYGVQEAVALADGYNNAANRIRQLTKDTNELQFVQRELFKSAQEVSVAYGDHVALYQKVGRAALGLGRNQEQAIALTELISKAIKASGADAVGAAAALQQLGQGLDAGVFRGEEFNSVAEQAPILLELMSKSLGKTRAELRAMAAEGQLTSQVVIEALEKQAPAVDEAFGKRIPTITDSFVRFKNEMSKTLGQFVASTGAGKAFAAVLERVGDAIKAIVNVVGLAVKAIQNLNDIFGGLPLEVLDKLTTLAGAPLKVIGAVGETPGPVSGRGGDVFRDAAALSRGEITKEEYQAREFQRRAEYATAQRFNNSVFGATTADVDRVAAQRDEALAKLAAEQEKSAKDQLTSLLNPKTTVSTPLAAGGRSAPLPPAAQSEFEQQFYAGAADDRQRAEKQKETEKKSTKDTEKAAADAKRRLDDLRSTYTALRDEVDQVGAAQRELAKVESVLADAQRAGMVTTQQASAILARKRELLRDLMDPLGAVHRALQEEAELLALSGDARAIEIEQRRIVNDLRGQGVTLSEAETIQLRAALEAQQALREESERTQAVLEAAKDPQLEQLEYFRRAGELLSSGAISAEEYARAVEKVTTASEQSAEAAERAANAYEEAVAEYETAQAQAVKDAADAAEKAREPLSQLEDVARNQLARGFDEALKAVLGFSDGLKESMLSIAESLAVAVAKMLLFRLVASTLGVNGGAGAFLGGLITGNFGSSSRGTDGGRRAGGGSFVVGGAGGVDSQPVYFMGTPGERVTISRPGEGGGAGGAPTTVTNKIVNVYDMESAMLEVTNTAAFERAILNIVAKNGGKLRGALAG